MRIAVATLAFLFLVACRATTSAQPVSGENSSLRASPTAADAGAKPEASVDGGAFAVAPAATATPATAATSSASVAPDAAKSDAADAIEVKGWFCFSWVHGRDFASPCFET